MAILVVLPGLAGLLLLVATFIWWPVADAQQRGKSPWLVALLVVAVPVLGWLLWLALRPPIRKQPTSRLFLPDQSWISDWALFLGVALSWYTVGTTWVAQMVTYPLRMFVGTENVSAYSTSYVNRIGVPIVLPVTLAMLLSVFLIWFRAEGIPSWMTWVNAWINAAMIVLARIYIRLQLEAERGGYSQSANARLLRIHWSRVAAFTADGLLFLWMLSRARRAAHGPERMHRDTGRQDKSDCTIIPLETVWGSCFSSGNTVRVRVRKLR